MEAIMEHVSFDIDIVAIGGLILIGIIWFVRLEAKVLYLEKSTDAHWDKLEEMKEKLDKIAESLARLEGKFTTINKEN